MKKLISMLMLAVSFPMFSQDIIVTKAEKSIKAKIEEVSDLEIRYKEWDNLDGPTFVVKSSELNMIIFKNGSIKNYQAQSEVQSEEVQTVSVEQNISSSVLPHVDYKKVPVEGKKKSKWRYVSENGEVMTDSEFIEYLNSNCYEAYRYYKKGSNIIMAGGVCCIFGIIPGLIMEIVGLNKIEQVLPTYNRECASK